MDVSLNSLTQTPDFWLVACVVMVAVLAAIFVGFFLLWQQDEPKATELRKLQAENQFLVNENARLRRLMDQWERVTKGHIERLRHELGQQ